MKQRDSGFTLTEVIVVTVLVALIATVVAATATVIFRATPATSFRIDDARSTRGLQTWLEQDIASTPATSGVVAGQGGFSTTDRNLCNAPSSTNLVDMSWFEDTGSVTEYVANYRLATDGTSNQVIRYTCKRIGSGSYGSARALYLTSGIDDTNCPSESGKARLVYVGSVVVGLHLCFISEGTGGSLGGTNEPTRPIVLEVASRNPAESF